MLLFLITTVCCNAQKPFPKDVEFDDIKGYPKQIVETTNMVDINQTTKDIYYFDKSGYLQKIEHYNWYDTPSDSLLLGDITHYKPIDSLSKRAITINQESQDTIRVKSYRMINDSIISLKIKEYKTAYKTNVIQQLDFQNRIISTKTTITDTLINKIKVYSTADFIYKGKDLKEIYIINDRAGDKPHKTLVKTVEKDSVSNFTHREYLDGTNTVVYTIKRRYVYY